jgi:hypothetical protein
MQILHNTFSPDGHDLPKLRSKKNQLNHPAHQPKILIFQTNQVGVGLRATLNIFFYWLFFYAKKLVFYVSLIIGVLFFGSFSGAFGEMMSTVGVARGDVFLYGYTCYFNSNDPNANPPSSFTWINQTEYFMINITGISGASVYFDTTMRGLNGSNSLGVCSMNVGTGLASTSGYAGPGETGNLFFMAPNVGMIGRMYPSANGSPTINNTLMMTYAGEQRLTNHFVTNTSRNGMWVNSDYYFDQQTGMMVEWRQEILPTDNSKTNATQMMKLTSSSVWAIPEYPNSVILPTLAIVAFTSIFAVLAIAKFKTHTNQSK